MAQIIDTAKEGHQETSEYLYWVTGKVGFGLIFDAPLPVEAVKIIHEPNLSGYMQVLRLLEELRDKHYPEPKRLQFISRTTGKFQLGKVSDYIEW